MIQRPLFSEGQILGADDLQQSLDYSRDQDARHARVVHTWGIANGLTVRLESPDELVLEPGLAIDSSGAVIVVSSPVTINRGDFTDSLGGGQPKDKYPLFLVARRDRVASEQIVGRCSGAQGTRVTEQAMIQFAALVLPDWDDQQDPPLDQGPDEQGPVSNRRVLLGFAEWDGSEFTGFVTENDDGIAPRYAGVRADELESVSGRLTLRTSRDKDAPMVVIAPPREKDEEKVIFAVGADDGEGDIRRIFRIDDKGNVTTTGTISGETLEDQILVQSGTITDGARVPLPAGIDDEQAANSTVAVHITLTPRFDLASKPATVHSRWFPIAESCFVADVHRRVECVFRWIDPVGVGDGDPLPFELLPGVCDYLIVVNVPAPPRDASP